MYNILESILNEPFFYIFGNGSIVNKEITKEVFFLKIPNAYKTLGVKIIF